MYTNPLVSDPTSLGLPLFHMASTPIPPAPLLSPPHSSLYPGGTCLRAGGEWQNSNCVSEAVRGDLGISSPLREGGGKSATASLEKGSDAATIFPEHALLTRAQSPLAKTTSLPVVVFYR